MNILSVSRRLHDYLITLVADNVWSCRHDVGLCRHEPIRPDKSVLACVSRLSFSDNGSSFAVAQRPPSSLRHLRVESESCGSTDLLPVSSEKRNM